LKWRKGEWVILGLHAKTHLHPFEGRGGKKKKITSGDQGCVFTKSHGISGKPPEGMSPENHGKNRFQKKEGACSVRSLKGCPTEERRFQTGMGPKNSNSGISGLHIGTFLTESYTILTKGNIFRSGNRGIRRVKNGTVGP